MVQIRNMETHEPLPGIEVGDIGAKLGYNSIDNGYLMFNNVKVPRSALLSRFSEITKEGDFEMKSDPRMLY
jgi:acyl-CoA oxidase